MREDSEKHPLTANVKHNGQKSSGLQLTIIGFVVISVAVTVALVVNCIYGAPEVQRHGTVVSDHVQCSRIGRRVLTDGGGAVDAAVATAVCLCVVHPHNIGLGGGGFMVVYSRVGNISAAFDFRERAPAAATVSSSSSSDSRTGGASVGVPGFLRGLQLAHAQYGRLPWQRLIAPSIKLASDGVEVSRVLAAAIAQHLSLSDIIAQSSGGAAGGAGGMSVFSRADSISQSQSAKRLLTQGDVLRQPELADSLEIIASSGADAFYTGALAESLVSTLQSVSDSDDGASRMTAADLSSYKALQYTPLQAQLGNLTVLTTGAPSGGAALLLQLFLARQLGLINRHAESGGAAGAGKQLSRDKWWRILVDIDRMATTQHATLGDPASSDAASERVHSILSAGNINRLASVIATNGGGAAIGGGLDATTPAASHVAVADLDEMFVSLVSGLGSSFGARIRTSSGIMLNNALASFVAADVSSTLNSVAPLRRPLSSFCPLILLHSQPCGARVVSGASDALAAGQAMMHVLNSHYQLGASIERARIVTSTGNASVALEYEHASALSSSVQLALTQAGYSLRNIAAPYVSVNAALKIANILQSHADSRGGGAALLL